MYLGKKVDLIITYVNCNDQNWKNEYEIAAHTRAIPAMMERFRSFGTLRYLFRGIDKYMSFVDRAILIVSSESQIPNWLNRDNVRIVLHSDYISPLSIPTFNSCTIESFFFRLDDLNDFIIYTNDDIYPLMSTTAEDFFTDGVPNTHFKFYRGYDKNNTFRQQCKNGANMIFDALTMARLIENKENPKFFKPDHCMSAMTIDTIRTVGQLCGEDIRKAATPFRGFRNVNQHIYLYYQYFTDKYCDKAIDYEYITFNDGLDRVVKTILNPRHKLLCINDSGLYSCDYDNAKRAIQKALSKVLPNKSKFEN